MYQKVSGVEESRFAKSVRYEPSELDSVQPLRLEETTVHKFQDSWFAIAFIFNLVVVAIFAFWKGIIALETLIPQNQQNNEKVEDYTQIGIILFGLSSIGMVLSAIWMKVLLSFAQHMIRFSLWLNFGFVLGFAMFSMLVSPLTSLIFFFMAMINLCYIYAVENRIEFASANLKCACHAVKSHSGIFCVAFLVLIKQLGWFVIWALGSLGVYQMFRESDPHCSALEKEGQLCGGGGFGVCMFFLLISLYWGQQVLQNMLTCTVAGTVASWWYQQRPSNAVTGAFYRATTTSFGSICFGSLIVAVLEALSTVARMLREKAREDDNMALACIACIAECILNILEGIMEYVNRWAYCYVGIYGYNFTTSGKAVMDLFKNRGWTAIINDNLTGSALGLGCFGVGLVTCGIGLFIAKYIPLPWVELLQDDDVRLGTFGVLSFIAGISMALILATVITSALHTIFVCFAEDPVAFRQTHPELYTDLVDAWRKFHPDAWVIAYGTRI